MLVTFALPIAFATPITGFAAELPPTLLTERGKLLLTDDFDRLLDKAWVVRAPDWETLDGALKATHRKPYDDIHGPVLHHDIALEAGAVLQLGRGCTQPPAKK
jgi:hypothetical protein